AFHQQATRAAGEPRFLRKLRSAAMERFAELGFPSPRQEDWKYTNVSPILRTEFQGLTETAAPARLDHQAVGAVQELLPHGFMTNRLVFIEGRAVRDASSLCPVPEGTCLMSLAEALARVPAAVEPHLGRSVSWQDRAFAALNTALLRDGAF